MMIIFGSATAGMDLKSYRWIATSVTVLAFSVVVSAQCNSVELLVNDKQFTDDTLYKPVKSNITVKCKCTDGQGKPNWLYSNGIEISECAQDSHLICTRSENKTEILLLSLLVVDNYTCNHGSTSRRLHIGKLDPPKITGHPAGGDMPVGGSSMLMCKASGLGTLVYSWENNSGSNWTTVSNDNTTSYTTDTTLTIGEHMYRCNVSNEAGSVVSNNATVNVYGPPTITTHPTGQFITANMSVTLNCTGDSQGPITYQWETSSVKEEWKEINITNSSRFVVTNLQESQQYRCIVSNEAGKTKSNTATIVVLKITTHPQNQLVAVSSMVNLTCTSSISSEVTFSWTHNGGGVTGQPISIGNTSILTITRVKRDNTGSYVCIVSHESLSVMSNTATLTVYGLPEITDHPTGGDVPMGRSITLMCKASGLGTLAYSWERSSGRRWTTVSNDNTTSYTTDTTLAIGEYKYRCRVSNEAGPVVSNKATVNVYGPPTITTHPTSRLTTVGMSVILNCEGTGRGSITYQWQTQDKGWTDVNNSNNRELVVMNLQESQQYRCVVINEAGRTISDITTLTILKITNQPSNTTVVALENITLNCKSSVVDVTYSWHRVSGSIPSRSTGQNSQTFTIPSATPPDEGMYYCKARKEGISVESNRAILRVDDKLFINATSRDRVIGEGGIARFNITASGVNMEKFVYRWGKREGQVSDRAHGRSRKRLTIRNVLESDEGQYYCNVTNEWGNSVRSDVVTLTVEAGLPVFRRHPQSQSVNSSDEVIFTCFVNGSDSLNITWVKGNIPYTTGNISTTDHSSILTIDRAIVNDSGKYQCKATNADGNSATSDEAELIILPQILSNLSDVTVLTGNSTQFTCMASGTEVKYQWFKNDKPMSVRGAKSNILTINKTKESHEGIYKCVVSNKGSEFKVVSNPATVTVYGPPIIDKLPKEMYAVLGEKFEVTCTAKNDFDAPTNLMFSWSTTKEIDINVKDGDEDSKRIAYSTLLITNVTKNYNGKYKCIVNNGGTNTTSFKLSVEEKPSPPLLLIIKGQIFTLQLTWSTSTYPHGSIDHYRVYISDSHNQQELVVNVTNFTGMYTVNNLRPYTVYSIYVTAVKLIGTTGRLLEGEKSRSAIGRTLAGAPVISEIEMNLPVLTVNGNITNDTTIAVDLPHISNENGPFRYLYIIIAVNNSVIMNASIISTEDLLEQSMKSSPLYYVAAVVYASQYVHGYRMRYLLGAGDNTTNHDGHVFNNSPVENDYQYFFRIFSNDSTPESEIYTTTEIQEIEYEDSSSSSSDDLMLLVIGVAAALVVFILIIIVIILLLCCCKRKYNKSFPPMSPTIIPLKGGEVNKDEPMSPSASSFNEPPIYDNIISKVVTSVGQPTTLCIQIYCANISEIVWRKDGIPVKSPIFPDGSLYIANTNVHDQGNYIVIANNDGSTISECIELKVIDPQLPADLSTYLPVKAEDFPEHVALMMAKKDAQFESDYQSLSLSTEFTKHTAKLQANVYKNRYKDIVPYDHSRVVLSLQDQITGSDYINASFIDGYEETRAYIAAQGPVNDSVDDFWRMIWEKDVSTIVMLARLVEDAKDKCYLYWPGIDNESATFGDIKVTVTKREETTRYCIRHFTVEKVTDDNRNEIRKVIQFHFTAWPDHGVPKYATDILEFQKRVDKYHKRKTGKPMLVHCSAGVGRTGAFIAIDNEIQRLRHEGIVNVHNFVLKMRYNRISMVQSAAQYKLIHVALLDYIAYGDTSISAPIDNVKHKINQLSYVNFQTKKTGFQMQFEALANTSPKDKEFTFSAATSSKNKNKNRTKHFPPPDSARVFLQESSSSHSNYINACYIDGYRHSKEFLVGPGPIESTCADFWRMIWENESCAIVMLGQLKENGEESSFQYWPNKGHRNAFDTLVIENTSEESLGKSIIKRIIKLTNMHMNSTRVITQLQYVEWPQQSCPSSPVPIIDMIEVLEHVQRKTGNGPITVHCSDGVGRSGTFCALVISINRFKSEQMVDVFRTIKTMRTNRPELVTNAEQYEFIHKGLLAMLQQYNMYANFNDGTIL